MGDTRTFPVGGAWETADWEIQFDVSLSQNSGDGVRCPHCSDVVVVEHSGPHRNTWSEQTWTCPRVVVARNEGGYCTTGVCLDCILEAAKTLNG